MEISSQEDHDIPIPINSAYGGGHGHIIHHHHHDAAHVTSAPLTHNNSNNPQMPPNGNNNVGNGHGNNYEHHQHDHDQDHHRHLVGYSSVNYKKQVGVKYKECLKNHAASMGGNATDGCGEFMPSGEEGSIDALTCSACNCHRNFHRKEVEGEVMLYHHHPPPPPPPPPPPQGKLVLAHHPHNPHKIRSAVPHQMIMPPYMGISVGGSHPYMPNSEYEDQMDEDGGGGLVSARPAHHQPFNQHTHHHQQLKKRFRTKFTQEQKEKMLNFAERAGWKIQRQEESVVQQFCQEIGVKRRVLKVWMHNNKHNLAKKNNSNGSNMNLTGNSDSKNNAIGNLASSAEENM